MTVFTHVAVGAIGREAPERAAAPDPGGERAGAGGPRRRGPRPGAGHRRDLGGFRRGAE